MNKKDIDKFFESYSKDVLKSKWSKYDEYSKKSNSVTVNELVDVWNFYYDNTFVFKEPVSINIDLTPNIEMTESEITFGLFFYFYSFKNLTKKNNESSKLQIC